MVALLQVRLLLPPLFYLQFKLHTMNLIEQAFAGLKLQDSANAEAVAELLEKFNLRWTVSKQQLQLPDGTKTSFFGLTRDDNSKVFMTCKDSYIPYQNSELAELLLRIADKGGYEIHSGGEFNGGAKVFIQLNSGLELNGIGENRTTVKGYITGINSHDGSSSLKWGAANLTICCKNLFAMAAKQLENRVRHTTSMHSRIDSYLYQLDNIKQQEKTIFERFITMADRPVTKKDIATIVDRITGVDVDMPQAEAREKYSSQTISKTNDLLASISTEMNQKGQTAWGLFSGVTHYTSHRMPVPKRDNARLESKHVGTGLAIDNNVFAMFN
jgi:phage/plasmid-like protein (TIGR03299 family)